MIKKSLGYRTDDGKMFATLDEAAGHTYGQQIKAAIGKHGTSVFGVGTVLKFSREIEAILHAYNAELDRIDSDFKGSHDQDDSPDQK